METFSPSTIFIDEYGQSCTLNAGLYLYIRHRTTIFINIAIARDTLLLEVICFIDRKFMNKSIIDIDHNYVFFYSI